MLNKYRFNGVLCKFVPQKTRHLLINSIDLLITTLKKAQKLQIPHE